MTTDTTAVTETVTNVIGGMTLMKAATVAATLVVGLAVTKIVDLVLGKVLATGKLDKRVGVYVRKGIKTVLLVVTILVVADQLGIPITSLVALLSVMTLAISLAVQTLLSNVAGGLVILGTNPFTIGDYIEAGSTAGTVAEIHLTHTCLDHPNGLRIVVPNGSLSADRITNYTRLGKRRINFTVTASYDAAAQTVRQALLEAMAMCPQIYKDPAPAVYVDSYGESSIAYIVRCWCDAAVYWDVYFPLMENIRTCFEKYGVEMTYNHLNVHILEK